MSEDADATAEEPTEDVEPGVDTTDGDAVDSRTAAEDTDDVEPDVDAADGDEIDAGAAVEDTTSGDGDDADAGEDGEAELERSLLDRVAEHDEALAAEIRDERADYEERIDDLESKLTRKQADFQNFKKRQQKKLEQQRARATEDLVERLLPIRDNLARALEQGGDADIREGVEGTLRELDRVLEDEGAERIEPELGDEPDPERHEVLMRVESDQRAGTVAECYRPGYEMGEKVIRTAQVTVSEE